MHTKDLKEKRKFSQKRKVAGKEMDLPKYKNTNLSYECFKNILKRYFFSLSEALFSFYYWNSLSKLRIRENFATEGYIQFFKIPQGKTMGLQL